MSKEKLWWGISGGLMIAAMIAVTVVLNLTIGESPTVDINSGIDIDNGDTKINWDKYPSYTVELTDSYTITAPGTYYLSGSISDGMITVKLVDNGVARLVLDNVNIKNSSGPAIACYSGEDLVIELTGENYLEDGASYASDLDEDVKGAIYSKADLSFAGDGILNLTANYADGIVSKDDLKFNSGTYKITAADDAVRGKDSVYIAGGEFDLVARGDTIKSTNDSNSAKGFVLIEAGKIAISAGDDAIHAYTKLVTRGGEIAISKCYEGLEAQVIEINDGDISIIASDDGINAGGGADQSGSNNGDPFKADESKVLSINGGNIYVNAAGDGVDSNGWIYFNGGTTIVDGPTNNGNGALDAGAGIVMNGGKVIAVGASGMAESLGASSTIYNINVYFNTTLAAGTKVEIKNTAGETVLSHTTAKTFNHLAAGSSEFKNGETYTIYLNGAEYTSFTISSITTTIGNGGQGGQGGGPGAPAGPGGQRR